MSDRQNQHWSTGPASQPRTPPSNCAFPGAECLTPLTLVRKDEASSNPQAFTNGIWIPDLNLPEIINVVRDCWAWVEQPWAGNLGPGTPSSDCPSCLCSPALWPQHPPASSPCPMLPAPAAGGPQGHPSRPLTLLLKNHQGLLSFTTEVSIH